MGTGPFAVPSCKQLLEAGHEPLLVVVRPAAGRKAPQSPVQLWAEHIGLPIEYPASINSPEAIGLLRSVEADLYFVCDYGQILSRECLSVPRLGGINLHGSLLPRHRGAAPVQWTILSGDSEAGVSVIHMTPGLDAGPILARRALSVLPDESAGELETRLSQLGAGATLEAMALLESWDGSTFIGTVQDKAHATKAPRLNKADGQLDCSLSATQLERKVRGYQPWPGVYGELIFSESKRLMIHLRTARAIEITEQLQQQQSNRPVGSAWSATAAELGQSGEAWVAPWDRLLVIATGQHGLLAVSIVQAAGKRAMSTSEFFRGHPLNPTAHFADRALANESPMVE